MPNMINDNYVRYRESKKSYYIKAKANNSVVLTVNNFYRHIKRKHPEMSIAIILDILVAPDMVYQASRNNKDKYYEKTLDDGIYRVVVSRGKPGERVVATAYRVECPKEFIYKHTYCIYDKNEDEDIPMQNQVKLFKEKFSTT